jgi:endoglucanase
MNKRRWTAACLMICLGVTATLAAQEGQPFFKKGDKVCFVGNSITNNGEFYHFIYLYYATRFPAEKIRFYNCGISGDVAGGVLTRLENDVFVHDPTHTVLMIGMNDVKRGLYSDSKKNDPATPGLKEAALREYRANTTKLVQAFQARHAAVVLLKPTIYDQTGALPAERCYGVDDALDRCAEHMANLSKQYHTGLVDFRTVMKKINHQLQEKDSTATIVGNDRVHPGSPGHFVMAYQFLATTGAGRYVSKMVVEGKGKTGNLVNCNVRDAWVRGDSLSFTALEHSLPFPVREDAAVALEWIPFTADCNQEILQLPGLAQGQYDLLIDGQQAGRYAGGELQEGVNLALNKNTPQYRQALKVMDNCLQLRKTQALLRNLRFVECKHLADTTITDLAGLETYLFSHLEKDLQGEHYEYYKKQFQAYLVNKAREKEFQERMIAEQDKVYMVNQPVPHQFLIIKRNE